MHECFKFAVAANCLTYFYQFVAEIVLCGWWAYFLNIYDTSAQPSSLLGLQLYVFVSVVIQLFLLFFLIFLFVAHFFANWNEWLWTWRFNPQWLRRSVFLLTLLLRGTLFGWVMVETNAHKHLHVFLFTSVHSFLTLILTLILLMLDCVSPLHQHQYQEQQQQPPLSHDSIITPAPIEIKSLENAITLYVPATASHHTFHF